MPTDRLQLIRDDGRRARVAGLSSAANPYAIPIGALRRHDEAKQAWLDGWESGAAAMGRSPRVLG